MGKYKLCHYALNTYENFHTITRTRIYMLSYFPTIPLYHKKINMSSPKNRKHVRILGL